MYSLSERKNSYGIVKFDHDCFDYSLFDEPASLKGRINKPLIYTIAKQTNVKKISGFHLIESTGPELVSNALRQVIEHIAPREVEFFDVDISFEGERIEGFNCIHPLRVIEAMDMDKSEYEVCAFDPNNPDYTFSYLVLKDEIEWEPSFARCQEFPPWLLVNEEIKKACFAAKLKGLVFSRAIDMTHGDRGVNEVIK